MSGVMLGAIAVLFSSLVGYLVWLNNLLATTPEVALKWAGPKVTDARLRETYERIEREGIGWHEKLPKAGAERRYIVVGGGGFLGSQIILDLIQRGTPAEAIRIIDLGKAKRKECTVGEAAKVPLIQADVTKLPQLREAYGVPWPSETAHLPLVVLHTAAIIRPYERFDMFYDRCARVNVTGAALSLEAAREAGARAFVLTSSGVAGLKPVRWFAWPGGLPGGFLQVIREDDFFEKMREGHEFNSTYARSKAEAERIVCGANEKGNTTGIRTGALRPGSAIYGNRDNNFLTNLLDMYTIPTWIARNVQNLIHVRNVSLAHIQYVEALTGPHADKVSGRPYIITDNGGPTMFQTVYDVLHKTSRTGVKVVYLQPVVMLLLAFCLEFYCVVINKLPLLKRFLSEPGDPVNYLQPSIFDISNHNCVDDTAARREPADGGFGYDPACNSLDGLCFMVKEWNESYDEKQKEKEKGLVAGS